MEFPQALLTCFLILEISMIPTSFNMLKGEGKYAFFFVLMNRGIIIENKNRCFKDAIYFQSNIS